MNELPGAALRLLIVDDHAIVREGLKRVLESTAAGLSLIHISEPTRLLSSSYAGFCLKKKNRNRYNRQTQDT